MAGAVNTVGLAEAIDENAANDISSATSDFFSIALILKAVYLFEVAFRRWLTAQDTRWPSGCFGLQYDDSELLD